MKLPTDLSGRELVKVLVRVGFFVNRQKGSHIILRRADPYARVVVPITINFVLARYGRF